MAASACRKSRHAVIKMQSHFDDAQMCVPDKPATSFGCKNINFNLSQKTAFFLKLKFIPRTGKARPAD